MAENIGPLDPECSPFGTVRLNDNPITHYVEIDLPDGKDGEVCREHFGDGRVGDMMGSFWETGCHFPEEGDPQVIRNVITCSGPTMFRRHCRLRILQASLEGEVITEGKYSNNSLDSDSTY